MKIHCRMGMKSLMCEILCDEQKEIIKSLEILIKSKNKTILEKSKRANEMFKLSYNRKLKIEEQQAEIDRLREAIRLARDTAYQSTQDCPLCGFIDDLLTKTLNEESEGK